MNWSMALGVFTGCLIGQGIWHWLIAPRLRKPLPVLRAMPGEKVNVHGGTYVVTDVTRTSDLVMPGRLTINLVTASAYVQERKVPRRQTQKGGDGVTLIQAGGDLHVTRYDPYEDGPAR